MKTTIRTVCGKGDYGLVASATDKPVGPKFLRTTDMIGGVIDWDSVPYCEVEGRRQTKCLLQDGDIVISRTGANAGAAAYVSTPPDGAVFAGYLVRFRADPDLADARFLGYVLRSQAWANYVANVRTGSAQPQLNADLMARFEFDLPTLDEQRRIVDVLGSIDDLIVTNERLGAAASELRALTVWRILSSTDEEVPLSTLARFVNGKNFTKDADGRGRPIVRTPEVRLGVKPSTLRSSIEGSDDNVARPGDVLFVWSGSLCIGRWTQEEEGLVNQHVFKVLPNESTPDWLVYSLLEGALPWFIGLAADKATTMGHIQRAHLDVLVPRLHAQDIARLDARVRPLWDLELQLAQESEMLRRTRDELLPLLMSGKVRVKPEGVAA